MVPMNQSPDQNFTLAWQKHLYKPVKKWNIQVDYNEKEEIGFSYVQTTIINGSHMSSNKAYLNPTRDNLHVTLENMVIKLLIDPNTKRAIGVEFVKHNQTTCVIANKEVKYMQVLLDHLNY